jgi:formylmethanofuran dehydrogenase subunit E
MRSDGQQYLCCEKCGEFVNSSEAAAHRCLEPTKAGSPGSNDVADGLSLLFDAMEHHGNAEGTETQLGDTEEFLRLAVSLMTADQQAAFLAHPDVIEFVEREADETWRCRVCGDPVAKADFREHLGRHNPNALGMEAEDVAARS